MFRFVVLLLTRPQGGQFAGLAAPLKPLRPAGSASACARWVRLGQLSHTAGRLVLGWLISSSSQLDLFKAAEVCTACNHSSVAGLRATCRSSPICKPAAGRRARTAAHSCRSLNPPAEIYGTCRHPSA